MYKPILALLYLLTLSLTLSSLSAALQPLDKSRLPFTVEISVGLVPAGPTTPAAAAPAPMTKTLTTMKTITTAPPVVAPPPVEEPEEPEEEVVEEEPPIEEPPAPAPVTMTVTETAKPPPPPPKPTSTLDFLRGGGPSVSAPIVPAVTAHATVKYDGYKSGVAQTTRCEASFEAPINDKTKPEDYKEAVDRACKKALASKLPTFPTEPGPGQASCFKRFQTDAALYKTSGCVSLTPAKGCKQPDFRDYCVDKDWPAGVPYPFDRIPGNGW